ncbi:hypothetical protein [Aromatoleum petrolei]|uniref:Uncharacterized protein n=1 Tax=Aromatoleum petrolei TaxID=76116 RepID=A0ABX1MNR9_9RHOO|nr:hypothetical protein [Aromatoleum petrolei]NMF88870.1 hypothetical protein [Aromatoleum petrolei]QTQ37729.1 Uncharacterized protein ToN1_36170 [Aromatoleum petrolei]
MKTRIVVRDIDGAGGVPEPNIRWRITAGATELDVVANRVALAEGETDSNGEARLSEETRAALYDAWRHASAERALVRPP